MNFMDVEINEFLKEYINKLNNLYSKHKDHKELKNEKNEINNSIKIILSRKVNQFIGHNKTASIEIVKVYKNVIEYNIILNSYYEEMHNKILGVKHSSIECNLFILEYNLKIKPEKDEMVIRCMEYIKY